MGKNKDKKKNRGMDVLPGLPVTYQPPPQGGYGQQPPSDPFQIREIGWWSLYKRKRQLTREAELSFYETEVILGHIERAKAMDEFKLQPLRTAVTTTLLRAQEATAIETYRKLRGENELTAEKIRMLKGERKKLEREIRLLEAGEDEE